MKKVSNNFPIPTQAARNCRKFFSLIDDVTQVVQKIRKAEKKREFFPAMKYLLKAVSEHVIIFHFEPLLSS